MAWQSFHSHIYDLENIYDLVFDLEKKDLIN